jgi:DNA polymerase II small subunit/DNA polymerase delta subunit B
MNQLKRIMDLGVLVEPEAAARLKSFSDSDLKTIMSKVEAQRPLVLSEEVIKEYLKTSVMRIIKQFTQKTSFSVQDYVNFVNERFSFLQSILVTKMEAANITSINKCGRGNVTIIGMVKSIEKKDTGFAADLEDTTGSIKAVIPEELGKKIEHDDVIAVTGNINNSILFADNVIWPDVPLREPKKSNVKTKIAFMTNYSFEHNPKIDSDYLIVSNCENIEHVQQDLPFLKIIAITNADTKTKATKIRSPCLMEIDGVVILVAIGYDSLKTLRKRYIIEGKTGFLIDPIPDIVFTDKPMDSNYKGISVISPFKTVDISTREMKPITV